LKQLYNLSNEEVEYQTHDRSPPSERLRQVSNLKHSCGRQAMRRKRGKSLMPPWFQGWFSTTV